MNRQRKRKNTDVFIALMLLMALMLQIAQPVLALEAAVAGAEVTTGMAESENEMDSSEENALLLPTEMSLAGMGAAEGSPSEDGVDIDETNFPDAHFREFVKQYDENQDEKLQQSELDAVTLMSCNSQEIADLTGIEHFTMLTELDCSYNQLISLDVSSNTALVSLDCYENQLSFLDVSENTALEQLNCPFNQLTSLNISENTVLIHLDCSDNKLTSLDVRSNTALVSLDCYDNELTLLDLSENTELTHLDCAGNQLTSLDVSENTELEELNCSNNHLSWLDLSNNPNLKFYPSYLNLSGQNAYPPLSSEYNGHTYQFDLSDFSGIDLTNITNVRQKTGNALPETAHYDPLTGIVSVDPTQEIPGIQYDYDVKLPQDLSQRMDVSVDFIYTAEEGVEINETNFPDAHFREFVKQYDNNHDEKLQQGELNAVTVMNCSSRAIADLAGIEHFTMLTELDCSGNQLTSLDVSGCISLSSLNCSDNELTLLDLSENTELTVLNCSDNQLSSLHVSACTMLEELKCFNNHLSSLDLSSHPNLHPDDLAISNQKVYPPLSSEYNGHTYQFDLSEISDIDLANITDVRQATGEALPETAHYDPLTGIVRVDPTQEIPGIQYDYDVKLPQDASQRMAVSVDFIYTAGEGVEINEANFPDAHFREFVKQYDNNHDEKLQQGELDAVTEMNCSSREIADLTGIEHFTALKNLNCSGNQLISLDLGENTALEQLNGSGNQLTSLDVSENTELTHLDCSGNQLTSLDVSGCAALISLACEANKLSSLNVSEKDALTSLSCYNNQLDTLDVGGCISLSNVNCSGNQLTALDISDCISLNSLNCSDNELTLLDLSENTELTVLNCSDNQLSSLHVSTCTMLEELECFNNHLSSLDLSSHPNLHPDDLAISGQKVYPPLSSEYNGHTYQFDLSEISDIDLTNITDVRQATGEALPETAHYDPLTGIVRVDPIQEIPGIQYDYDVKLPQDASQRMAVSVDFIYTAGEGVEINEANFPDAHFREFVKQYDNNHDEKLQQGELDAVTEMNCSSREIADLKGIEHFTMLTELDCSGNQLSSLDVSNNTALTSLQCGGNQLISLDVSSNTALTDLWCESNQLSSLDVSENTALTYLDCGGNSLSSLHVSNNAALETLYCQDNQLTSLDVSSNTALTSLDCKNNQLTSLDVSSNTALIGLYCSSNQLSSLDVSSNTALRSLDCESNQLSSLDVSENAELIRLNCSYNQLGSLDLSNNTNLDNQLEPGWFGISGQKVYPPLSSEYDGNKYQFDLSEISGIDLANITDVRQSTGEALPETAHYDPLTGIVRVDPTQEIPGIQYDYDVKLPCDPLERMAVSVDFIYTAGEGVEINEINFPDAHFREFVKQYDNNHDEKLQQGELDAVTEMNCSSRAIADLKGIEHFTALKNLNGSGNQLTSLDVSENTELTHLDCSGNRLTSLDVSGCAALISLACEANKLSSLHVSEKDALTSLSCYNNQLDTLDVGGCISLSNVNCSGNQLTALDISDCISLNSLNCSDNELTLLDLSENTAIVYLDCSGNQLTSLDVSGNTLLEGLNCSNNHLSSLDLSNNPNLKNYPSYLNLSGQKTYPPLSSEYDGNTYQFDLSEIFGIDLANITDVRQATGEALPETAHYDPLTGIVRVDPTQEIPGIQYDYDVKLPQDASQRMVVSVDFIYTAGEGVEINETNFPDAHFREFVKQYDKNNDEKLQQSELNAVTVMNCSSREIADLKGIEHFTALKNLNCSGNQLISLDVSGCPALTGLYCHGNQLTSLDVSGCAALKNLHCTDNQLTSLDVSGCPALTGLYCYDNQLTSLDVNDCTELKYLNCSNNQLTSLDVSGCTELTYLDCLNNRLSTLDVSGCTSLTNLDCTENQLTTLDVGDCTALEQLYCFKNQLNSLDLSGNTELRVLYCYDNRLSSLDVSNNTVLEELNCSNNQLSSIDLSSNPNLHPNSLHFSGQKVDPPLSPEFNNGTYQFDLSEISGVDLANVTDVRLESGDPLPETADYDPLTGIVSVDPLQKVLCIGYDYDVKLPQDASQRMFVTVDLTYDDNKLIVIYQDEDGNTVGEPQMVDYGSDAVPETVPPKEGYTGVWDHDGKNITADTVIKPVYTALPTPPAPVENLRASAANMRITLTWNASPEAEGYIIYRRAPGEEEMKNHGTVSSTSFVDDVEQEGYHFYRVYPYKTVNGERIRGESTSYVYAKATQTTPPAPVENLKASAANMRITLTWNASPEAEGYIIYRRAPGEEKMRYCYMVSGTSYVDNVEQEGYHFYRVYPYKTVNEKRVLGKSTEYVYAKATQITPPAPVKNLKASAANMKITLTWDASPEAEGYMIYRQAPGEETMEYHYMVGRTSYVDNVEQEGYHFYRVYPYRIVNGRRIPGESTSYVYAKATQTTPPAPVENLKASAVKMRITLTWDASPEAEGYIIYRRAPGEEKMRYCYMVSGTSYVDNVEQEGYHFYRVYPYKTVNGKRVLGESTSYVYAKSSY